MARRGPDGSGLWLNEDHRVGLAHRRLAIIDTSSAGAQPMASRDGNLVITFNGEIYNYKELRRTLQDGGYVFQSMSDTEVLLGLYERESEKMVHRLRGMFAFAIWDLRRQKLFAARDPFGIKPFYYSYDGQVFRFASQVTALLEGEGIRTTPEPAGHVGFSVFGFVPEPFSLHREIRALPAGCHLSLESRGSPRIQTYYSIADKLVQAEDTQLDLSFFDQVEILREGLRDSVVHHLVADVPVGVFLSSGIDSCAVAACVQGAGVKDLLTITLGFKEFFGTRDDEVPIAEKQAALLKSKHITRRVTREEFWGLAEGIWSAMDQPTVDGINTWLVSKAAAELGLKVCLSGLGGDELFAGYSSFADVPRLVRLGQIFGRAQRAASVLQKPLGWLPERILSPKYRHVMDYSGSYSAAYLLRRALFLPAELHGRFEPGFLREGLATLAAEERLGRLFEGVTKPRGIVGALELGWYMRGQLLRDADWAGMAHGLELRVPFVDTKFFETVAPMLVSNRPPEKAALVAAMGQRLVREVRNRPKTGFATPLRKWLEISNRTPNRHRGLRGWSRAVYSMFVQEVPLSHRELLPPRLINRDVILVYRIGQLGDTLVALPTFEEIRKKYPRDQILLITDRHPSQTDWVSAWDVVGPTKLFDGVIFYEKFEEPWKNLLTYYRLAKRVRQLSPKAVFNLVNRTRDKDVKRDRFFFTKFCGIHCYSAPQVSRDARSSKGLALARATEEWIRMLDVVGSSNSALHFKLRVPRWAESEATYALSNINTKSKKMIAIGPGSKMSAKRWPAERFVEVCRRVVDKNEDVMCLVLGGREDQSLGARLCEAVGAQSLNLAGRLSIFGSAAVVSRCIAYLGNDTGTMHLAGVVGTPCVAIFSARDLPGRWEPYGAGHVVLRHETECAGCMLEICDRDNACLRQIKVDDAYVQVERLLNV